MVSIVINTLGWRILVFDRPTTRSFLKNELSSHLILLKKNVILWLATIERLAAFVAWPEYMSFRKAAPMKRRNIRQDITRSVFCTAREERRLLEAFQKADLDLLQNAAKAFGGVKGAGSWLASPAFGLGGKIPILHARTSKGKAEVVTLMNRIDRGVLP